MKLLYALQYYDILVFRRFINMCLHKPFYILCRLVSRSADGYLYVLAAVASALNGGVGNPFFQATLVAFAIERPLYFALKNGLKRNRPQETLDGISSFIVPSDQFSFPSGHTSAAFMMATLVSEFWPGFALPLYAWAGCVGCSRVLLGVHFPSDTLIGAAMGVLMAYASLGVVGL